MKKPIPLFLTIVCLFSPLTAVRAQDDGLNRRVVRAIRLMDAGLLDESGQMLQSVLDADPNHYVARYELAFLRFLQEDFKACAQIVAGILDDTGVQDTAYQLLGNAYDKLGKRKKALETYREGLKKFPESGKLLYEQGIVAFEQEDYLSAIAHFEDGIAVEPDYPSNYYGAAVLFLRSDQPIWGIFYGEMFMNLERGSTRTEAMSGYLYNAFRDCIEYEYNEGKQNISLKFCNITIDPEAPLPYAAVCELMLAASFPEDAIEVDLDTIIRWRTNFLGSMHIDGDMSEREITILSALLAGMDNPNVLLDYQRRVSEAGHLDAYHHWILRSGDFDRFNAWLSTHQNAWDAFMEWFVANPIRVDKRHYFHRKIFES